MTLIAWELVPQEADLIKPWEFADGGCVMCKWKLSMWFTYGSYFHANFMP